MKAAAGIKTPAQYLASLPGDRRDALTAIHRAIVKAVPAMKPFIFVGMIGYGKFHYKYPSGREGDWAVVALASQKHYISLYICAAEPNGYLAEMNKDRLGKVSVGRSCIRFKQLKDLNLKVAIALVKRASALMKKGTGSIAL